MLIFLKFLEFRQMRRHFGIRGPLTIPTVISHTEGDEVVTHNPTDIQLIVEMTQRVIMKKFMFRVSHGILSIKSLTPIEWVGRHATKG